MIEHANVLKDCSIKTAAGISMKICEEIIKSFKVVQEMSYLLQRCSQIDTLSCSAFLSSPASKMLQANLRRLWIPLITDLRKRKESNKKMSVLTCGSTLTRHFCFKGNVETQMLSFHV